MKIAYGKSRQEKTWRNDQITWPDFCARVSATVRTPETVAEYRQLKKGQQDEIKDVGGYVAGHLREGRRKKGFVLCRSMIVLDMDQATPGIWEEITMLRDFRCCIYSTHKHTPEHPRLRLVIPLSREISEEEYPAVARMVAADIGIQLFDETTYEAHRLMYWPSTSRDGEFFYREQAGEDLDPDRYLARYTDWRDASTWPRSGGQPEPFQSAGSKAADPHEKPGIIGAFNRAYRVEEAIGTFLPQIYEPSLLNGRYDYIPADSAAGLVIYEGKFAYSHHASDPVCGLLLSAFDLVRLHLFRNLDDKTPEDTPINKLPSYKAMADLAAKDGQVKLLLADERRAQARREFGEPETVTDADADTGIDARTSRDTMAGTIAKNDSVTGTDAEIITNTHTNANTYDDTQANANTNTNAHINSRTNTHAQTNHSANTAPPTERGKSTTKAKNTGWEKYLEYESRSTVLKNSLGNLLLILKNDPYLQGIRYNLLAHQIYGDDTLPWTRPHPSWRDADSAQLVAYVERTYGTFSARNFELALTKTADDRSYHPIREYLDTLPEWDGVARVDTLLIRYFGADDSPYTRSATRKTLAAAVARIYRPGIKFDAMLVLNGQTDLGKSTFFARLAGEWFSDSLNFADMGKGKDAAEKIQGVWIVEIPELAGLSKMDVNNIKGFLSRQDDQYRPSYGRSVESHPRQCILVGSTNAESAGFLRDATGNRRFWVVRLHGCAQKGWDLPVADVPQIWAEVKHYWAQGETLYLEGNAAEQAKSEQTAALETDEREGLVREYLDTLLPEGWYDQDIYSRKNYFSADDPLRPPGVKPREYVSNMEIWCECFGNERGKFERQGDSYKIKLIMQKMEGWVYSDQKKKLRGYGAQYVWVRIPEGRSKEEAINGVFPLAAARRQANQQQHG